MNELSEESRKTLLSIIDNLLLDASSKASEITLYNLVHTNRSLTMELFSQNIEEYLYYMVAQRVTTSFSTSINKAIGGVCEYFIKSQEGLVLPNPEPYNLKFKLKNGEEYWMDIVSVNDPNGSNKQAHKEHKDHARKNGKTYKLCVYDDDNLSEEEEYRLNGNDFWKLIAGMENAKQEVFRLVNGAANKISVSSIVKETQNRLLNEWRMQF